MRRIRNFMVIFTIVFASIHPAIAHAEHKLNRKDQVMASSTNEKWTTHCVGRFLIDLPSDAEFFGGHYEYAFGRVEQNPMKKEDFRKENSALRAKLETERHRSGTPLLVQTIVPNDDTQVFAYWGHKGRTAALDISGYKWIDGIRYTIFKHASPNKVDFAVSKMKDTLAILQKRAPDIPSPVGFCIPNAIFADGGRIDFESLNARFRLKNNPDIVIDLATTINTESPPESLLSRKPSVFSGLGLLGATLGGVRDIREGARTIGVHPGQEWLLKAPNEQGQQAHLFTWEAPGLHASHVRPQIRIDLQSGNTNGGLPSIPISKTDEQMLELWEKILNSLRLRPVDGADAYINKKTMLETNKAEVLPLGELALTGALCPQSGYWQCPEPDLYGSTRLFHQGAAMPSAFIKRNLSFIERVKGVNAEISIPTVWRLVKYAEVPAAPVGPPPSDAHTNTSSNT